MVIVLTRFMVLVCSEIFEGSGTSINSTLNAKSRFRGVD